MDQVIGQEQNASPHTTIAAPSQLPFNQQPSGFHHEQQQDALTRRAVWTAFASPSDADSGWAGAAEGTPLRVADTENFDSQGPSVGFQVSDGSRSWALGLQGAEERYQRARGVDEGKRRTEVGKYGVVDAWSTGGGEGYGDGQVREWPPSGQQQHHHRQQQYLREVNGGVGGAQHQQSSPSGDAPGGAWRQQQHQGAHPFHDNLHPYQQQQLQQPPQPQQQHQQVHYLHEQEHQGTAYHISAEGAAQQPISQPPAVSPRANAPHTTEGPTTALPSLAGRSALPEPGTRYAPPADGASVSATEPAAGWNAAAPVSQQQLLSTASAAAPAAADGGGRAFPTAAGSAPGSQQQLLSTAFPAAAVATAGGGGRALPTASQQAAGGGGGDPSGLGSGVRAVARDLAKELRAAEAQHGPEVDASVGASGADVHLAGYDARATRRQPLGLAGSTYTLSGGVLCREGGGGDGRGYGVGVGSSGRSSSAGGCSARSSHPELSRLLAAGRGTVDAPHGNGGCEAAHGQVQAPGGMPYRNRQQQQMQQGQGGQAFRLREHMQKQQLGGQWARFERLVPPSDARQASSGMGSYQQPLHCPHPTRPAHGDAASDWPDQQQAAPPQAQPAGYPDACQNSTQEYGMHDVGVMAGEDYSGADSAAAHAPGASRAARGARLAPSLVRVTAASAAASSLVSYAFRTAGPDRGRAPYPLSPGQSQGPQQTQPSPPLPPPPPESFSQQQPEQTLQQQPQQHIHQQQHVHAGDSPWGAGTSRGTSTMATPDGASGTTSRSTRSSGSTTRLSHGSITTTDGGGGSYTGGAAGDGCSTRLGTYQHRQHAANASCQSPTGHSSHVARPPSGGDGAGSAPGPDWGPPWGSIDAAAVAPWAAAVAASQATSVSAQTAFDAREMPGSGPDERHADAEAFAAAAAAAEEAPGAYVTGHRVPQLQRQQQQLSGVADVGAAVGAVPIPEEAARDDTDHRYQQLQHQQQCSGVAAVPEVVGTGPLPVQPAPPHALRRPWRPAAALPLLLRLDNPLLSLAWEEEEGGAASGSEGPVGERSAAVGEEGQAGCGGGRQSQPQHKQPQTKRESVQLQLLSAMVADMMEHMGLPERVQADSHGTAAPPSAPAPAGSLTSTTSGTATSTAHGDTRTASFPSPSWQQLRLWVRGVLGSERCGYGGGQPAHCAARAVHATHLLWYLLQATEASRCLQPLPQLALLLAGLLGEAGHPGLTSGFLVTADHPIALRHAGVAATAAAAATALMPVACPLHGTPGMAAARLDGKGGGGAAGACQEGQVQVQVLQAHICEAATEQLLLAAGRAGEARPGGAGGDGGGGNDGGGGGLGHHAKLVEDSGLRPEGGRAVGPLEGLSVLQQRTLRQLVCRAICASAPGHLNDIMQRVSASLERRQQLAQQQLPAAASQGAGAGAGPPGLDGPTLTADSAAWSLMEAGDPEYVDALLGLALHVALRHGHLLRPWARCRRLSNAAAEELAAQAALELQLGLPPSLEAHGLNPRNQALRELELATEEAVPALQLLLCALGGPRRDGTEGKGGGGARIEGALGGLNSSSSFGEMCSGQGGGQLDGWGRDGASAGGAEFGREGAYLGAKPGAGAGLGAAQSAGMRPGEMLRALYDNLHHNALMWRVVLAAQEGSGDVVSALQ